jgi:hypothetical protein
MRWIPACAGMTVGFSFVLFESFVVKSISKIQTTINRLCRKDFRGQ